MTTNYAQYMSSEEWRSLREQRLKLDNHRCQTCGCTDRLEVHHVYDGSDWFRYPKPFGEEDVYTDLITLCYWCHEAITNSARDRRIATEIRYGKRAIELSQVERTTPVISVEVKVHGKTVIEVSDHIRSTPAPPQRTDCRPLKPLLEADEANQWQARKDGRRF